MRHGGLYADENLPLPVLEELKRMGHDDLRTHEAGNAGESMPDEAVPAFAFSLGRAVLTLNRKHFIALHKGRTKHAGIIVCSFDPDFVGQAQRIHTAVKSVGELRGKLIRVNRPTRQS